MRSEQRVYRVREILVLYMKRDQMYGNSVVCVRAEKCIRECTMETQVDLLDRASPGFTGIVREAVLINGRSAKATVSSQGSSRCQKRLKLVYSKE